MMSRIKQKAFIIFLLMIFIFTGSSITTCDSEIKDNNENYMTISGTLKIIGTPGVDLTDKYYIVWLSLPNSDGEPGRYINRIVSGSRRFYFLSYVVDKWGTDLEKKYTLVLNRDIIDFMKGDSSKISNASRHFKIRAALFITKTTKPDPMSITTNLIVSITDWYGVYSTNPVTDYWCLEGATNCTYDDNNEGKNFSADFLNTLPQYATGFDINLSNYE